MKVLLSVLPDTNRPNPANSVSQWITCLPLGSGALIFPILSLVSFTADIPASEISGK
jgi:hypothetical protein